LSQRSRTRRPRQGSADVVKLSCPDSAPFLLIRGHQSRDRAFSDVRVVVPVGASHPRGLVVPLEAFLGVPTDDLQQAIPRFATTGIGETVAMLVAGRDIRILDDTGELIRQLTLDPTRDYQPKPETNIYAVSRHQSPMSRHITQCRRGDLNPHALAGTSPSRQRGP
jgi:hypothetical protein